MTLLSTELESLLGQAARLAAEYLEGHEDRETPVTRFVPPDELRRKLALELPEEGRPLGELLGQMQSVLHYSVRTGHPRFFNQLFTGYDAAAILGEWVVALINTSMYTYEAAPVATLMERVLIDRMNRLVGFPDGEGVFAPGGSTSNLMSVLAARHRAFPHVKERGLGPQDRPVMFTSAESHYSLRRAASIAGLGTDGAVEIPCDELGRMRPDALVAAMARARGEGRTPFLVAATAGTTVPGAFDPLPELAAIAEAEGLWLHVDASYGGTVLFSRRHRHLLKGIERAHSVSWNPHKMMGVPLACSATLVREKGTLLATNGMNADYLFHGGETACWDTGDMTLQCGRRVDALKLWFAWQVTGDEGFERRVDRYFELARWFRDEIDRRPGYRLVREPMATNVCFRYLPPALRGASGDEALAREERATVAIREAVVRRGHSLINYAGVDGVDTFRIVIGNRRVTQEDLSATLDEIEAAAEEVYGGSAQA
jgi:glutamate/tyrosine decarboxylase-like PLP-dependent enzyme